MGIGASIFLIVVGAIITFALDFSVAGVDMDVVGWILMVGGVIGLIFTAFIWGPRNRTVVTRDREVGGGEYRRVDERSDL